MAKIITEKQQRFLDALVGEAKGDLKVAKQLAGYAETTTIPEIVRPIKDEVIEAAKELLAFNAPKAAQSIIDVLDSPNRLGVASIISASKDILDRIGVVKPENNVTVLPGTIILPDKNPVDSANDTS